MHKRFWTIALTLTLLLAPAAQAATPGLPFIEDFYTTDLQDPQLTNANWSSQAQALMLAERQPRFGAFGPGLIGYPITSDAHDTMDVAMGDLDGDGDLDVVAVSPMLPNRFYLNDGTANPFNWVSGSVTADAHGTFSVAIGDVDGDGDLDVVAGNAGQVNRLYLNNGSANPFDGVSGSDITADAHSTYAVALGDLDEDGDLDLVVGNEGQANRLYLNNGTADPFDGVSGVDITADAHGTRSTALGDMDGDGDLDLVVGNAGQANRLYLNNGTANPFDGVSGVDITTDAHNTMSVALGDADGDGDLDVVAGNYNQPNRLYLNDGDTSPGWTGADVSADAHATASVALGDVDGDGDLDVVAGNYEVQANRLHLNNGTANPFDGASGGDVTADAHDTTCVALGDLDGDGDLDIVAGNANQANYQYLNNGSPNPFNGVSGGNVTADTHDTRSIALGDVNDDGDLDLVAGNYGQANRVYLNDGSAPPGWTDGDITTDAHDTTSIALGDVDGDGDLDVVAGNFEQANRLYLNDGAIVTGANVTADAGPTTSIALGDVDGDGDLDVVASNGKSQPNRLYLNDGNSPPGWAGSDISSDAHETTSVVLGDVDGDGDLDLVVGNMDQANRLYLNNGTSDPFDGVSGSDVTADAHNTTSLALGDVDGDGDLDLAAGNYYDQSNRLYLNDGNASPGWTGSDVTADAHDTNAVALEDADGDGDLDLVAGNYDHANRLYLNNGTASPFAGASGEDVAADAHSTYAVALGDVDSDGDLDLAAGNHDQTNRLYQNVATPCPITGWVGDDVSADAHSTTSVALGDVDRDGDLDVVAGNFDNHANRLYLNNGTAEPFDAVSGGNITTDVYSTTTVALGDVDRDGDLDLVVGNLGQANRLYLNDGNSPPGWTGSDVTADADDTNAVALGDVDGDGDLDIVAGNKDQANRLYLNDGGTPPAWTGADITADDHSTFSVALGDVDGDGDLDVVAGNYGQVNRLYLNDGASPPAWTGSDVSADAHNTHAVTLSDIDGNGDLDLIAGNMGQLIRGYLNNGTTDPFNGVSGFDLSTDAHNTTALTLGDVNKNGALDLVVGNWEQTNQLMLNNTTLGNDVTTDAHGTYAVALGDVDGDGLLDVVAGNTGQPNRLYRRALYNTGHGRAGSLRVDDETSDIDQVTVYPSEALSPNTGVTYWLSNNGGSRWYIVRPGFSFAFPTNGMDLRWRAELHSLSPVLTPRVDQVAIGGLDVSPPTQRWVTHTGDGGAGSLRWAITLVNESSCSNTIMFDIPAATDPGCVAASGVCTIQPASGLPALDTHGTLVDGYTQSGAAPATATTPAALKIELDGTLAGASTSGLRITSASNTVRGLVINRFGRHGINIYGSKTMANVIAGNHIGTDVSGSVDLGNAQHGVRIGLSTRDNTVGGDTPAERNVISGNDQAGIHISDARDNTIVGNYIGADAAGDGALGNGYGIGLRSGAQDNVIGGERRGDRNVISGNDEDGGISISDSGTMSNTIAWNYIGLTADGTSALSNGYGVHIADGAHDNTVGPNNVIAHNLSSGIKVMMAATLGNVITHNSIFSNTEGIDLTLGANGGIAAPLIITTTQGSINIIGTACSGCTVELFENGDTDGEGETYVSQTVADASGNFTVTVSALTQPYLTATATDVVSGTSEFSAVFTATLSPAPSFNLVYLPLVISNH